MKKIFALFIVLTVTIVLIMVATKKTTSPETVISIPTLTPSPTPILPSLFQFISPGSTTASEAAKIIGPPLSIKKYDEKQVLIYRSQNNNIATNIDVDQAGIIEKIVEPINSLVKFETIRAPLGQHDLELYGILERSGFKVYVYLSKGIALLANQTTQEVSEKWTFKPTTQEAFLSQIAPNLTRSPNPENQ